MTVKITADVRYWIKNGYMPPGSKDSWYNRFSFMGASVSGGEIRYFSPATTAARSSSLAGPIYG